MRGLTVKDIAVVFLPLVCTLLVGLVITLGVRHSTRQSERAQAEQELERRISETRASQEQFVGSDTFAEWLLEARKENPDISLKDAVVLCLEEQFLQQNTGPLEEDSK